MTEVVYSQLADHLQKKTRRPDQVCLIHGEATLVDQCLDQLVGHLLEGESRDMCCESVDGLLENIPDALSRVNTYSLLGGPKLVLFKDAKLFDTRGDQLRLVEQIKEAYESDRIDRAAKAFLTMCGRLGVDLESTTKKGVAVELQPLESAIGADGLSRLLDHCCQQGWSTANTEDALNALMRSIEKGFPAHHALLMTAYAKAPKNRKLYKAIQTHGLVIDCSVPLGERRADKMAQEAVLRQTLEGMLSTARKKLASGLFGKLIELTGFDLPTFMQNVKKLIDYVGDRNEINATDIHALLRRTKSDPLYELTNAVADRNLTDALFYLHNLLNTDWHPLQILAALANQMRKLLVAKDFSTSRHGKGWSAGLDYNQFQRSVLPAIQEFDTFMDGQIESWQMQEGADQKETATVGVKKGASDLALAANPNNAYPIFQTLLKSEKYTRDALIQALGRISEVDVRLKSTGQDAAVVLTSLLLSICSPVRTELPADALWPHFS